MKISLCSLSTFLLISFVHIFSTDLFGHRYYIKNNGDFELFQKTEDTYHIIYNQSKEDSIKVPVRIFDTRHLSGGDLIFEKISDWSNAIRMYLFFSLYSSVEWTLHVFYEIEQDKIKYILASNQSSDSSPQSLNILERNLKYSSTILLFDIHSHPSSGVEISYPSESDFLYFKQRHEKHLKQLPSKFFIFDANSKQLISYNTDTVQIETHNISQYLYKFMKDRVKEIGQTKK